MSTEIIVMLTHHDVTVPNSRQIFRECADLPVTYWGFKDVGLSTQEARLLAQDFREAGKSTVLEVVSFEEDELQKAVDFAIDCGIEYFTGASFSPRALQRLQDAGMTYFPFAGDVGGSPVALRGTQEDVVADAVRLLERGADGIDLVPFRAADIDPVELSKAVLQAVDRERVVIAGSINSPERVRLMHELDPFAFTMGGALFDGAFAPGRTFRENLQGVVDLLDELRGVHA